ncbi:MAG: hypothetical protein ACK506_16265 [Pirellula sp.]
MSDDAHILNVVVSGFSETETSRFAELQDPISLLRKENHKEFWGFDKLPDRILVTIKNDTETIEFDLPRDSFESRSDEDILELIRHELEIRESLKNRS